MLSKLKVPRTIAIAALALLIAPTVLVGVADEAEAAGATDLGAMVAPRKHAAAAAIGGTAYIFGGRGCGGYDRACDSIERYVPGAASSTLVNAKLPTPRAKLTALPYGSHIYLFGGDNCSDGYGLCRTIHRYDPASDTLATLAATLPTGRYGMAGAVVGNYAYLLGGHGCGGPPQDCDEVLRYDFTTGILVPVPLSKLPAPRHSACAEVVNGELYLAGGRQGSTTHASILRLDRTTGSWSQVGTLSPAISEMSCATYKGKLYLFGGRDSGGSPSWSVGRWTPGETWSTWTTGFSIGRLGAAGVWIGTHGYVFGGEWSSEMRDIVQVHVRPGQPHTPTVVPQNKGQLQVSWWHPDANTYGSPITAYKIYRALGTGGWNFDRTVGVVTAWTDTGLPDCIQFSYAVAAVTAEGEGEISPRGGPARTNCSPSAPIDPAITRGPQGAGTMGVSWKPPTSDGGAPVDGYRVFRAIHNGSETPIAQLQWYARAHTDTGLAEGVYACYRVRAFNVVGDGPPTDAVCGLTPIRPSPPRDLVALPMVSEIQLRWQPPVDFGGTSFVNYRVYRSINLGPYGEVAATVGTSWPDRSCPARSVCSYYVIATNGLPSAGSNTAHAVSMALFTSAAQKGTITLDWNEPSSSSDPGPVTGYRIFRGASASDLAPIADVGTVLSFEDTGLTPGATLYYEVQALRGDEVATTSNVDSAMVPGDPPSAPQALVVTPGPAETQATLRWSAPSSDGGTPITHYRIYRAIDTGAFQHVGNATADATTYTESGLYRGAAYSWYVTAVNIGGESEASNTATGAPLCIRGCQVW